MLNRQWLNSLSNKELAKLINKNDSCDYCIRSINGDCESEYCQSSGYCEKGIEEWLETEHEKPMPEIKEGDCIFFQENGHVYTAFCVYGNSVYLAKKRVCTIWNGELKKNTFLITRYNRKTEEMEVIWRADK